MAILAFGSPLAVAPACRAMAQVLAKPFLRRGCGVISDTNSINTVVYIGYIQVMGTVVIDLDQTGPLWRLLVAMSDWNYFLGPVSALQRWTSATAFYGPCKTPAAAGAGRSAIG